MHEKRFGRCSPHFSPSYVSVSRFLHFPLLQEFTQTTGNNYPLVPFDINKPLNFILLLASTAIFANNYIYHNFHSMCSTKCTRQLWSVISSLQFVTDQHACHKKSLIQMLFLFPFYWMCWKFKVLLFIINHFIV